MLYNFADYHLPSEGFSGGSQSSVAGYSQLPFPTASQTHLTSGTEGWWETFCLITINSCREHDILDFRCQFSSKVLI